MAVCRTASLNLDSILGQFFALLVAACWAQNSIVYTYAGRRVGSTTVTHLRLWVALPAIILVHLVFTGKPLPLDLNPPAYLYLSISGLAGFCIADLCIFKAFIDIGPRETLVIMTTSPIFSAAGSWVLLGEVLAGMQVIGIVLTIAGVGLVLWSESRNLTGKLSAGRRKIVLGALFALAGTVAQAAGMTVAKYGMGTDVHPVSANVLRISAGLAGVVVFSAFRRQFVADFKKMKDVGAFLLISSGALIGPVLGIVLTLYALTMAPVGVVTTIMQMSPIMLLPFDRYFLKRRIPPGAVFGTLLAVGGAVFLFIG